MPPTAAVLLQPRKHPVQARSAASVRAILQATIQVLLGVGKDKLTTTRVAARAGVSVGTLYQYFPNKRALLQAALKEHLDQVNDAVERVCQEQQANSLRQMAAALVNTFFAAKLRDPRTSVALYSVSADVDGATIAQALGVRSTRAIVAMLATAPEHLTKDLELVATLLQGAMAGVSRRLLESGSPEELFDPIREELIVFVSAYLDACSTRTPVPQDPVSEGPVPQGPVPLDLVPQGPVPLGPVPLGPVPLNPDGRVGVSSAPFPYPGSGRRLRSASARALREHTGANGAS